MAYVLHWIHLAIVTSEQWVSKVSQRLSAFNFLEKSDWTILFNAQVMAFVVAFGHPSLSLLSDIEFQSLDSINLSLDNRE